MSMKTKTQDEIDAARYRVIRDLDHSDFAVIVRRTIARHWASESYEDAFDRILDEFVKEQQAQMKDNK